MIKTRLPQLMADKKIRVISQLAKEVDLDRRTITALYDGTNKGIDYETLLKLCDFFNCEIGELLYIER